MYKNSFARWSTVLPQPRFERLRVRCDREFFRISAVPAGVWSAGELINWIHYHHSGAGDTRLYHTFVRPESVEHHQLRIDVALIQSGPISTVSLNLSASNRVRVPLNISYAVKLLVASLFVLRLLQKCWSRAAQYQHYGCTERLQCIGAACWLGGENDLARIRR